MWLLSLTLALQTSAPLPELRVACLGDSITYGARVVAREHNAYPAQLQALLGPGHAVRNYGVGGRTLLSAGDTPFVQTDAWREALAWEPDVAVVLLGTNDTVQSAQRANWEHAADLESDARAMASALLGERPGTRVLLCAPTAMLADAPGLDEARVAGLRERARRLAEVAAALRRVARDLEQVEFVDLSRLLGPADVVDGVHTTPFGARRIAERLAEAVRRLPSDAPSPCAKLAELEGLEVRASEFHGFRRHDFALPGPGSAPFACTLVEPETAAAGLPWIWRARFFGHEPELDRDLLDRGYHLAYVDVGGLFGADDALERWDRFHAFARGLGLAERVTLEAMSRGGLVALNWTARRPELVEAVYLDNPVCDFRSWPGGRTGKRSDDDWARCLAVYGLSEEEAAAYAGMPLDRLAPIASARVPIFLVQSSADEVVPAEENGEELARRFGALGGDVQVWRKPGVGHHPHGLYPVAPLRRELLHATGRGVNPAALATPSAEYRGHPAGWGGGTWWDQLAKLQTLAAEHPDAKLVFLGDSITQGLTGSADRVAHPDGARLIDRYHGARGALGLGLSGDRTEHLLYRIEHGALATVDPRVVVLAIGVNNVNAAGHTGRETAEGLHAVVAALLDAEPQAHVLICGPFPAGKTTDDPRRRALDEVHVAAEELGNEERVIYADLRPLFLDETGAPNARMAGDAIHLNEAGREAWLAALEPLVARLLGE